MFNNNVSYAQAHVNERLAVLSEHSRQPRADHREQKPRRFWHRLLSLWL